jgi:hypothetical protein
VIDALLPGTGERCDVRSPDGSLRKFAKAATGGPQVTSAAEPPASA